MVEPEIGCIIQGFALPRRRTGWPEAQRLRRWGMLNMSRLFTFKKPARKQAVVAAWQPGDTFRSLTGKSIAECKTIDDIDEAVSRALKKKGPLTFDSGTSSGFVVRSGDVFPHSADTAQSISEQIDSAIGRTAA